MSEIQPAVRHRSYAAFDTAEAEALGGHRRALMRGQNFWCEWIDAVTHGEPTRIQSDAESLLITDSTPLRVVSCAHGNVVDVPGHAACILPAGGHAITASQPGSFVTIASHRGDLAGRCVINDAAYHEPDPRIRPTGRPYRRLAALAGPQVLPIDAVRASAEKPRLKMLQTETLSVNIVEYEGPRSRNALSPHRHSDFEQGSLALAGQFIHHLRVTWSGDADLWRDDEHLSAGSPSLLVVPVEMIHTSEGVGPGRHVLIDVFSPPRHDFIANGWVFNAGDYRAVSEPHTPTQTHSGG